jgi:hypothetical protein
MSQAGRMLKGIAVPLQSGGYIRPFDSLGVIRACGNPNAEFSRKPFSRLLEHVPAARRLDKDARVALERSVFFEATKLLSQEPSTPSRIKAGFGTRIYDAVLGAALTIPFLPSLDFSDTPSWSKGSGEGSPLGIGHIGGGEMAVIIAAATLVVLGPTLSRMKERERQRQNEAVTKVIGFTARIREFVDFRLASAIS